MAGVVLEGVTEALGRAGVARGGGAGGGAGAGMGVSEGDSESDSGSESGDVVDGGSERDREVVGRELAERVMVLLDGLESVFDESDARDLRLSQALDAAAALERAAEALTEAMGDTEAENAGLRGQIR